MEEINHALLPEHYSLRASMSFKKGKFSLFANVICLVLIATGFVMAFLLFDYSTIGLKELSIRLLILALIVIAFILINPIIQVIFYKVSGGGKIKLHFGLVVDYSENAIKRNNYILAQLFSNFIPLVVLSIFAIFFWSDVLYLSLIIIISNGLAYIPVHVFVLKHDKTSLIHFNQGALNIFTKNVLT